MASRRKYAFAGLLTMAICALALYVHRHKEGRTGFIDNMFIALTGTLQEQSMFFVRGLGSLTDRYLFLVNTERENESLSREIAYLKTKVAALQEVEAENERLRRGLAFSKNVEQELLPAHVTAHDVSPEYFGIRIDVGEDKGVRRGMGVISAAGLVGRVQRVTKNYADVLTLLDPTSSVDAVVQRSRARGILSGLADKRNCQLKYVDQLEDVAEEDTVVSSGFGGVFPKGLLMGFVTEVERKPNGVVQEVTVRSAVDIYQLEEVFIVFPPAETEKVS